MLYPAHLSAKELTVGLNNGSLFEGSFSIFRANAHIADVAVKGNKKVIKIVGSIRMNRALNGDIVVIKVLFTNAIFFIFY